MAERWHLMFMSALLASASAIPVHAAADSTATTAVQEVIITATKRSQNLQSVPISVQALTPKTLNDHQVVSFDDYAKLLPSVSFQSFGPGQSQLYFRGIASGNDGLHSGSEPATGIYIDETPLTTIANTPDMHVYDISRVEALSGPQGTLFGASSMSGTLRIITNAPDPSKFSAGFDLQGDSFGKGGQGGIAEGYLNQPITDRAAIRLVAFDEHDGGYIDNVVETRTFALSTGGTLTENNAPYVKKNFNDVDTYGGRAALKVELDDNWTVTPSLIYQHQRANGNFLFNPKIGDLKVADFSPDLNVDQWYQAGLTIQGKIADWDVLYSGGYFGRHVDNQADYSYYSVSYDSRGLTSYATFPDGHGGYLDPDQHFSAHDVYTKESHELRFSSPTQNRLRAVAGLFYERQTDAITANYYVSGLGATGDLNPTTTANNGFNTPWAVPGEGNDIFYTNIERIDRDFATFGELSYDILPNLTASVGGRYFTVDNTIWGFSGFASNVLAPPAGEPCVATNNVNLPCVDVNKKTTEYGETHKLNLTWKVDSQRMLYATLSTGFRPGGNNRYPGIPPYAPDTLTNYEVGWKTSWLDGRLRWNGAVFDEEWHGVQYSLSPPGFNGLTLIYNAGYARSYGAESDITWRVGDHWTFSGSGTVLDAFLTKSFCSYLNTTPPTCDPNQTAPSGTPLPVQPKYKFNLSARYEFLVRDYKSFIEADAQAQGESTSALFSANEQTLGPTKPFATFDASTGFSKDNWTFSVFVQNMLDRRGILSINTDCAITYCGPYALDYPIKPQFFGVKFGAKY